MPDKILNIDWLNTKPLIIYETNQFFLAIVLFFAVFTACNHKDDDCKDIGSKCDTCPAKLEDPINYPACSIIDETRKDTLMRNYYTVMRDSLSFNGNNIINLKATYITKDALKNLLCDSNFTGIYFSYGYEQSKDPITAMQLIIRNANYDTATRAVKVDNKIILTSDFGRPDLCAAG